MVFLLFGDKTSELALAGVSSAHTAGLEGKISRNFLQNLDFAVHTDPLADPEFVTFAPQDDSILSDDVQGNACFFFFALYTLCHFLMIMYHSLHGRILNVSAVLDTVSVTLCVCPTLCGSIQWLAEFKGHAGIPFWTVQGLSDVGSFRNLIFISDNDILYTQDCDNHHWDLFSSILPIADFCFGSDFMFNAAVKYLSVTWVRCFCLFCFRVLLLFFNTNSVLCLYDC